MPCGSCPYRLDAPSGLWAAEEYAKLLGYDGDTIDQVYAGATRLFFCHLRTGDLCAGWVGCHDTDTLLALRMHPVDPVTYDYESPVPLHPSGAAAAAHGIRDIDHPDERTRRKVAAMLRLQRARHAPGAG